MKDHSAIYRRRALTIAAALAVLSVVFCGVGLARLSDEIGLQREVGVKLGFFHGTPIVDGREVFIIRVAPNGPMAEAGFQSGDLIQFPKVETLYRTLVEGQGETVVIPIERGGKQLNVSLRVPQMQLS